VFDETNPPVDVFPIGHAKEFLISADRRGLAVLVSRRDIGSAVERLVFANTAACITLKSTAHEILGTVVQPGRLARATYTELGRVPEVSSTHGAERLIELRTPDGQCIVAGLTASEVVETGAIAQVYIVRTLELQKPTEPTLRDGELRFRRLMDVAPDGMVVLVGTRIVYANEAVTRVFGYSHPRQIAQLGLDKLFVGEDGTLLAQRVERLAKEQLSEQPFEARAVCRDLNVVSLEVHLLRTEWDDATAVLMTLRDLSGRRHVQSELVHTDRLAAVGTLAAGVAHEINNPLAYVLLNLQYLIREIPRISESYERMGHLMERLREARHGAARVATIVRDLKTFSKADEEQLGPVDLKRVLTSAIKVARTQLMDRGTILESYASIPAAWGHPSRLEQVFLNLLINAIQALPSDRGTKSEIRVRTYLEVRMGQPFVSAEVSDNGLGIAPAILDRVFDPFFTTKPAGLGTGLGLPICHSIVTRMGGTIQVRSKPGEGTSFCVTLPVALSARTRLTPYPMTVLYQEEHRAKILVVDDEFAVATMLSRVLDEQHEVLVATSGEQALELLEQHVFDVIFCDLLMPSMSGMDLYGEVRYRHPGQESKIAFMTGGAFTPRAAQFLSRVQNPRIEKPFDLLAVRAIVREVMSGQNRPSSTHTDTRR